MKAEVEITDDMAIAHALCEDKTDCDGCPCLIGTADCIYNYVTDN